MMVFACLQVFTGNFNTCMKIINGGVCLLQVFTGNSNTCMKIMGHQVQKIMSLVAQHRESIPQFLDLLNAVVKVEELDLPLKRNQSFVMTYFMQYRADIATVIDRPEQER